VDRGARRGLFIQLLKEKNTMQLSEPKNITFWIAVILGLIGVVLYIFTNFTLWGFIAVLVGLVLLVLGNLLKGL
jgi:drug/metabolite transporter (DMT)-like permease